MSSIVALPTTFAAVVPANRASGDAVTNFDGLLAQFGQSTPRSPLADAETQSVVGQPTPPPIDAGGLSSTVEALVAAATAAGSTAAGPTQSLPGPQAPRAVASESNEAKLAALPTTLVRKPAEPAGPDAQVVAEGTCPCDPHCVPHQPEQPHVDASLPGVPAAQTAARQSARDVAAPPQSRLPLTPDGPSVPDRHSADDMSQGDPASRDAPSKDAALQTPASREPFQPRHQSVDVPPPVPDAALYLAPMQTGAPPASPGPIRTTSPFQADHIDLAIAPDVRTPSVRSSALRATAFRSAGADENARVDINTAAPILTAPIIGDAGMRPGPSIAPTSSTTATTARPGIAVPKESPQSLVNVRRDAGALPPPFGATPSRPDPSVTLETKADPAVSAAVATLPTSGSPAAQVDAPLQALVRAMAQPEPTGPARPVAATVRAAAPPDGAAIRPASKSVTIRLTPDHLGPVEIRVRLHGGSLDIDIRVVTPEALDSLAQDKHLLAAAVASAGGQTGDMSLTQAGPGADPSVQTGHDDLVRSEGGWSTASHGGAARDGHRGSSPFATPTNTHDDHPQAPPDPASVRDGSLYL